MKVLIHTGYLSYESFNYVDEYRTRENPLHPAQTKAYDVSIDEKFVRDAVPNYYIYDVINN